MPALFRQTLDPSVFAALVARLHALDDAAAPTAAWQHAFLRALAGVQRLDTAVMFLGAPVRGGRAAGRTAARPRTAAQRPMRPMRRVGAQEQAQLAAVVNRVAAAHPASAAMLRAAYKVLAPPAP